MGDAMLKTAAKIYAGVFEDANSLGKCMEDVFIPANGTMVAKVSKALQDAVVAFLPSMQALALAISVVFFLIALLELTTQERLTLEFFIKFFGKLVISFALIASCETLTKILMLFGEGFGTMFKSFVPGVSATGTAPTEAELYDIFNASDILITFSKEVSISFCSILEMVDLSIPALSANSCCVKSLLFLNSLINLPILCSFINIPPRFDSNK